LGIDALIPGLFFKSITFQFYLVCFIGQDEIVFSAILSIVPVELSLERAKTRKGEIEQCFSAQSAVQVLYKIPDYTKARIKTYKDPSPEQVG